MINIVWFVLISIGVIIAALTGKTALISSSIFTSASKAIEFSIGLAGIIAFWSGMLKIAEEAQLTQTIAQICQPLLSRLFPEIPSGHKVLGLISLTITANLFGLGNVATPLGLKTMTELQTLNPNHDQASNAICTFMALVFGGISLLPSTLISIRAQTGSDNPALIMSPVFIVSLIGTFIILIINYLVLKYTNR